MIIISLLGVNTILAQEKVLYYDLVKGGRNAGYMKITKSTEGNKTIYSITSRTEVRVVFMVRVNYDLYETHENGVLVGGHSKSTLNGALQKETKIKKFSDKYQFELASDLITIYKDKITYTIPEIYFKKPTSTVKVFSQVFAEYLTYEKQDDKTWVLYSEDGRNMTVYDENGICELVEISRPYAVFKLVLDRSKSSI